MSEEKELDELNLEDSEMSEDIKDFVDLADFSELGDLGNFNDENVFGDLGDLTDLGELPDLSDLADLLPKDTADFESLADSSEEVEDAIGTIPSDLFSGELDLDLFAENAEKVSLSDEEVMEDASSEEFDVMAGLEDLADAGFADEEKSEEGIGLDLGMDVPLEFDVAEPELNEDDVPGVEEPIAMEDVFSMDETISEDPVAMDEVVSIEEPMAMDEAVGMEEPMAMDEAVGIEEPIAMEEPVLEEPIAMDETVGLEEPMAMESAGLLDGLDLGFDVEPEPMEEAAAPQTENIDDMLGNLLDDLDMSGTMEESAADMGDMSLDFGEEAQTDDIAQLLGLGEEELSESDFASESNLMDSLAMMPEGANDKSPKEKAGFFKRVFGNIVTDEIAQAERDVAEKEKEELAKLEEEEAKNKEELEIKKAEKKAQKEAKAAERKKEKAEKKARLAEEKAEKKAQREEEEAAEFEVVGKLNKLGVSIIVIATVLFLTIEIVGTNLFGYMSTKNKAVDYFDMGKYTEAYAQAIGTDMKEKDPEEYDRIKVVMQVQQSLNAYNNYDRMKYYPEALNALLNGVRKYDANIEQAMALEVEDDMMSCRKKIITILNEEYGVSEAKAYSLIGMEKEEYEKNVVELGLQKVH